MVASIKGCRWHRAGLTPSVDSLNRIGIFRRPRTNPPRDRWVSYRYQLSTICAAFTFFVTVAVTVLLFESGPLAVGLSTVAAFLGLVVSFLLMPRLDALIGRTTSSSSFQSLLVRGELGSSVTSVLRSLRVGLIAAAGPAILTSVAYFLTAFSQPAIPGISLLALALGLLALTAAVHTVSLLLQVSHKSGGTTWHRPLAAAKVFVLCTAVFTGLTGAIGVLVWLIPRRIYLLDWAAAITAIFTFFSVIDTRDATIRAARAADPEARVSIRLG